MSDNNKNVHDNYKSPTIELENSAEENNDNSAQPIKQPWYELILTRKMLICIFTGFTSGLPLYFLLQLIPAWLRSEHVDLKLIAFLAIFQLPYAWKFLWAPLVDRVIPPFLGRRRGWMLITQVGLLISMGLFAFLNPQHNFYIIAGIYASVAFFSATQDIVLDAFRREILTDYELGLGNSIHVNAYRIAGLIPGSLSLILADHFDWTSVFLITAAFMLPGVLLSLFLAQEPPLSQKTPKTLQQSLVEPFTEFFSRKGARNAIFVLLFIFLYKIGDSMCTALATPFYIDMGFTKSHIGIIAKNAGLWPQICAGILGGILMLKIGINRALWVFGVIQAVVILGFMWLSTFGRFEQIGSFELVSLALVIGAEAAGVGLGTAAYVAFMARETNPAFTATQLALFTSLSAVPRSVINSQAGRLIEWLGYTNFFWFCFFLAIPGMVLLYWIAPWNEKKHAS